MPQRELASSMIVKTSIEPLVHGAPVNGTAVVTTDGDAQTIIVKFGDTVDTTARFKIQEDDGSSGWTDLTPVQTPALDGVLYGQDYPTSAPAANSVYRYAYVGKRGTIRVVLTPNGGNTECVALVIAGHLYERGNLSNFVEA